MSQANPRRSEQLVLRLLVVGAFLVVTLVLWIQLSPAPPVEPAEDSSVEEPAPEPEAPTVDAPELPVEIAEPAIEPETPPAGPPPNVIVIVSDDQGYDDVGYQGNRFVRTPQMDRLASEGMRMDAFRVARAVCSPSRAALLTGRYPERAGISRILELGDWEGLYREEVTLGEHFAEHGYATGFVGKWHVGDQEYNLPWNRGYETRAALLRGAVQGSYYDVPGVAFGSSERRKAKGYFTHVVTREALSFIRDHRSEPFFLWLAHLGPHEPLSAPAGRTARCARRLPESMDAERRAVLAEHYAMIEEVDDSIGQVVKLLAKLELDHRTLVVFLSDNGGLLNRQVVNYPFRGGKQSPLEGGYRVPFAMRWPGTIPSGRISMEAMSALDLFPTLCEAAGLPLPEGVALDGTSFWPLFVGQEFEAPDRYLFAANGYMRDRYANAPPHIHWEDPSRQARVEIAWRGSWKYILKETLDHLEEFVFDLEDPRPMSELANAPMADRSPPLERVQEDGRTDTLFHEIEDVSEEQHELMLRMRRATMAWEESLPIDPRAPKR